MTSRLGVPCLGSGLVLLLGGGLGCGKHPAEPIAAGSLVVSQVPATSSVAGGAAERLLDGRFPPGSRIILAAPPLDPKKVQVLSEGLQAAGEPFVTPDSRRVLFSGRTGAGGAWQVYEATAGGGAPRPLTTMEGGASSPTLLADGSVVFVSPVPLASVGGSKPAPAPALWALSPADKAPRRLTFGPDPATDPTVLSDGRILFVSNQPGSSPRRTSLFTIYNDGTGVSPYACQHDGTGDVARPRELSGGRVAFLAWHEGSPEGEGTVEAVSSARPWRSRAPLHPAEDEASAGASLHDPAWKEVEAIRVEPRKRPMGRISTINPAKKTGVVFSIDVNHTTYVPAVPAARIRITTSGEGGVAKPLGEVPVHEDGSFLAEVPADVPLGFEALDREGKVVRSLPPSVWVRPGENRGCIGCHEPHGLAPRNRRPLAVKLAPVVVGSYPTDAKGGGM
jgi:hypothetical protein